MIQLTREQQEQARAARQAGERRIVVQTTPEQERELDRVLAEEDAAMATNKAEALQRHRALHEAGFAGDLRRAIANARRHPEELARSIGVTEDQLNAFCSGEGELPSDAVARLVTVLRLRLMAEIR
jgi:hypothetical protein